MAWGRQQCLLEVTVTFRNLMPGDMILNSYASEISFLRLIDFLKILETFKINLYVSMIIRLLTFSYCGICGQYWGMNGMNIFSPLLASFSFPWTSFSFHGVFHQPPPKFIQLLIPTKVGNIIDNISTLKVLPFQ